MVSDTDMRRIDMALLLKLEAWFNALPSDGGKEHFDALIEIVSSPAASDHSEPVAWQEGGPRPTFEQVRDRAMAAVKELDAWTNLNETEWTGWGDGDVPPGATWWRIKSGQALSALGEIRKLSPKEKA
jgi:hypothetical protein